MWTQRSVPSILSSASAGHLSSYRISCPCFVLPVVRSGAYLIFVILLTPAPFSADTKNTPNPDLLTPKRHKIADVYTNLQYFDTRLEFWTPAPHVVHVTNIRYGQVGLRAIFTLATDILTMGGIIYHPVSFTGHFFASHYTNSTLCNGKHHCIALEAFTALPN